MAKILTTKGSSAALEDVLLKAQKDVLLISFHFIISESFLKILKRVTEKGVKVRMVYGKYIKMEDESKFKDLPNVQTLYYPNLHAKIFLNETKCIIGSMNFSEASEMNNMELGVLLTRGADEIAFKEAKEHAEAILHEAVVKMPMLPKEIHDKAVKKTTSFNSVKEVPKWTVTNGGVTKEYETGKVIKDYGHGFCIRTGEKIPLNHLKPLCAHAYATWAEYGGDQHYPEHFCHFTGEHSNGQTCYAMPVLQKNWKKYVKITGFNVL